MILRAGQVRSVRAISTRSWAGRYFRYGMPLGRCGFVSVLIRSVLRSSLSWLWSGRDRQHGTRGGVPVGSDPAAAAEKETVRRHTGMLNTPQLLRQPER
ncbi:hypothetical protein GCM10010156_64580 [Planobispora rosea]|uniref:Uncharacterized protein n=1 Tax=Planobispora rosea TaxID=35762 RepID=A0A8J3SA26_PLARO|nr:hypothetical protein GCM10010156_64580 [Planobispora rosea]GIH87864.1 hypothetical protein Pro02_62720 [Planobispora rosea]